MKKVLGRSTALVFAVIGMLALAGTSYAMMGTGTGSNTGTTVGGALMGGYMQMPVAQQMFSYGAATAPIIGLDAANSMPIGVGSVATGGNMMTIHAAAGQFAGPMDFYFAMYAPAIDPFNVYLLHQDGSWHPVTGGVAPWMSGVTGVDQVLVDNVPTTGLPKGTYTLGLMAAPAGNNMASYYLWTTHFNIQ